MDLRPRRRHQRAFPSVRFPLRRLMTRIERLRSIARPRQAIVTQAHADIRRRILDFLRTGERAAGEIAGTVGCPPSTLSHHLGRLLHEGLVLVRAERALRIYSLPSPAPLAAQSFPPGIRVFFVSGWPTSAPETEPSLTALSPAQLGAMSALNASLGPARKGLLASICRALPRSGYRDGDAFDAIANEEAGVFKLVRRSRV